jgi:hypothetical protein
MSNVNASLIDNMTPFFLKRQEKVTAALMFQTLPKLLTNVVGIWLMNEIADSQVWDSSSQGRHMTRTGSASFRRLGSLITVMDMDGASDLSRSSDTAFEATGNLSIITWTYKATAATQHPILTKTIGFGGNTNTNFYFVHGSSDNLNLTLCNGTTVTSFTTAAPVGEWFFGACSYKVGEYMRLFLGTKTDGWQEFEETTSIPASRNAAASTDVCIGATSGSANQTDGSFAIVAAMNSTSSPEQFKTYFEYTKALFF